MSRSFPICLALVLGACSSSMRHSPRPEDSGALWREKTPLVDAEQMTLERLLDSEEIAIRGHGKCQVWRVSTDPDDAGKLALERPWSDERLRCTGVEVLAFELKDALVVMSPPSIRRRSCKNSRTIYLGNYCGGPYTWLVHKRSHDAITLILPWKGDPAFRSERSLYQTWYRSKSACEANRTVQRRGGCH